MSEVPVELPVPVRGGTVLFVSTSNIADVNLTVWQRKKDGGEVVYHTGIMASFFCNIYLHV